MRIGEITSTATPNLFSNLDYGIKAFRTTLEVFNNHFTGIQDINGIGGGYAIQATVQTPGPYYLGVGTSVDKQNTVENCLIGVYADGYDSVRISNNFFSASTDTFSTGIALERTKFILAVLFNQIRDFSQDGIWLNDNPGFGGSTALDGAVSNNRIRGTNLMSRGIFIDEYVGGLTVKQDTIDRVWRGIGIQSSNGAFNIRENQVDFRYPGTSIAPEPAAGIYVLSSDEALILRNTISGNCPSPAGGGPCNSYTVANSRIRGIQLNQTMNSQIYNNTIQYAGAGVYIQGPNVEGNLVCNDFFDNYSAVVWDNLPVNGFGVTGGGTFSNRVYGLGTVAPFEDWSEKTFTSSIPTPPPFRSWSINGANAGSVDWYFQNTATYNFPTGTIGLVSLTALSPTIGDTTLVCSVLRLAETNEDLPGLRYSDSTGTNEVLNSTIRSRASAENLEDLYPQLLAWYRMGLSSTAMDSLLALTAIRGFEQMQSLWQEGNLVELENLLSSIHPTLTQEIELKKVWGVLLAAAQVGVSVLDDASFDIATFLSAEDAMILQSIARDTSSKHMHASYKAQSLLGWSILGDRWSIEQEEYRLTSLQPGDNMIRLYPNPAQSTVIIQSPQPIMSAQIYSLTGELVINQAGFGLFSVTLELEQMVKGIYLVVVQTESGGIHTSRLKLN